MSVVIGVQSVKQLEHKNKNDEDWVSWRNKLITDGAITGSTFPIWFGCGFQTLSKFLSNESQPESEYRTTVMNHGNYYEKYCLDALITKFPTLSFATLNQLSHLLEINDDLRVIVTPDICIENEVGDQTIIEIKCPYTTEKKTPEIWLQKHFYGYPSAFIQAALYGCFNSNIKTIGTLYGLLSLDKSKLIMFYVQFNLTPQMKLYFFSQLMEFKYLIEERKENRGRVVNKQKKLKIEFIKTLMEVCFKQSNSWEYLINT